ncbi:Soluble pyridine nucleotide transhydrogenase [anaerobic digester metagenome]
MAPVTVIGGGPAGRFAAMHLASEGREVRLVERRTIGGQCLLHGCMLVNALNDAARTISNARRLASLGALDGYPAVDLRGLLRATAEVQRTIMGILEKETRDSGVEVIGGASATFDGQRARIDGTPVESDAIIIATGSRPALPGIPGIEMDGVFTAASLAAIPRLPERLVILGGGIQAVEFAYIFASFGSTVDLVVRSELLRRMDPLVVRLARQELDRVSIHESTELVSVDGDSFVRGVTIRSASGERSLPADAVLCAVGLRANSEGYVGLERRKNGTIIVNDRMQTSVPGVYACGDVVGPPYLTPVAREEGRVAARNILGEVAHLDLRAIPQGFALGNQFAWAHDGSTSTSVTIPSPAGPDSFFTVPERRTGAAKVFVADDRRVAGIVSIAPDATLSVMYLAELVRRGLPLDGLDGFMEIHPTADGVHGLIRYLATRHV